MFMVCLVLQVVHGEEEIRCIPEEREALLQFKGAFVDRNGMLSSWSTPHCCQWQGIRCSNLTAHILSLLHLHGEMDDYEYMLSRSLLSQRYISGKIHKSLLELRELEYLNLSSNSFSNSHIPEFLGSLRNLKYLDLSSCGFGGNIPSQFGSLSHLKYLNLAWNSLEGSIPRQLGNLSRLEHLDLGGNSLKGNIPSQLGDLFQLQYLDLRYNFEGNIPSHLGNLSNLQELYLGGYHDTLKIDNGGQWLTNLFSLTHLFMECISNLNHSHSWFQVIAKLPKLRELSLVDCSLSDHFILPWRPFKFNFSASLSVLRLSENTFTSPMIFQWVSNISSNLVELDLSGNLLEGSTSGHFGIVMNSLRHLDLSSNRFKGGDMKSFANICTLHSLNMNENNLIESLPSILHNLSSGCAIHSLQELDLKYNYITGTLLDLSIFSSLKTLLLDGNDLNGKISKDVRLPSNLEILSMSSNSIEDLPVIIHHLSGCARDTLQELNLVGNKINGSLPDLSVFSNLKVLDLSANQLNGKIAEGNKLPSKLESLSIRSNSFEGGIPKSFGNACVLRSLNMASNNFNCEFSMIIHHLSGCARYSLEELYLHMNQINGTLPDLSTFTSLRGLYLYGNELNGEIPKDIQFPPQLELLDMQSNFLKGLLTDYHFTNMSNLKTLELSDNSLALEFTQNWFPSFQLEYIGLRSCKLGPKFPKWLQTQNEFYFIDISNATISDIVPNWFWVKTQLQEWMRVNISYNSLRGIIQNFPQNNPYYFISLGSNQFEGPIPMFIRNSLFIDLSKNKFSDFHSFLCANGTIQTLYQLHLSNNQFSTQIPDCWNNFKSLAYLDLSHNKLSGKLPTSMGSLLDLHALFLRNNNLVGGIPFSLRNCTKLVMLDMSENNLAGFIPDWIGTINELQILRLKRNRFYGSLPLQICHLRKIQLLDLSLNNLSGKIPKCIKNFTSMDQTTSSIHIEDHMYFLNNNSHFAGNQPYYLNAVLMWKGSEQLFENKCLSLLKSIDLSSNHFSEEIPTEIEKLSGLISLNLSRNKLIGKIPSNIGKLASLDSLDLSRNQLVGSIPPSLAQIYGLSVLDLSHNHLTGEIPTGTQLQSFNSSSYEDNLDLCGSPLKKLCIDGQRTQEPKVEADGEEYSILSNEFFMSMGIGFVISFWVVFGSILFKRSWQHAYFHFLNNLADNIHLKVALLTKVVVYGEEEIRCIPKEREALLQFKGALVLHKGMLSSWSAPHCCQWEGIRCSNLTAHILSLDLHGEYVYYGSSQRYISGEIHKSLMELRELEYLNLSSNYFPDSHIPEFLGSLRNLRYLDLSYSKFVGKIPSEFGSLSHLKYLNLAWNSLEGSIPRQLGNLSELHHLDLTGNSFENIPSQLGNLSNLQELYVGGFDGAPTIDEGGQWLCNLISLTHLYLRSISNLHTSHSVLEMIAKLPKLRELRLVDGSLSDHFILSRRPSKFNFSASLLALDLSWNTFTSPMIFQWVSNITSNLVELDLSYNLLEGSTSSHFGTSLKHLDLSSNVFKGADLKSFMNICTLHSLNLYRNNLSEDLPSILHNLSGGCVRYSLQELDLTYNHIIGTLPDVSVFSSLKALLLDRNQLSGKIPGYIKLPWKLEVLSISSNFLEGGVPKSFGNSCALRSVDISSNYLNREFPMIIQQFFGCARYSLQELNLARNQINGTLTDLSKFSSLKRLDLSCNHVNGEILEGNKLPPSQLEYVKKEVPHPWELQLGALLLPIKGAPPPLFQTSQIFLLLSLLLS
ncbi:unnamed protein product [Sphenostylis stenocarpa]|uniref:Uncharacterized protein n=1 Tax=Sphenostylis stenocarpa TaxID=92480 RepID=A0AA86VPG2_9FABA|nr:unnamed protein product [Sphenostylis stenocarpa]